MTIRTTDPQIVQYSVRTNRPFAGMISGDVYDVLPCEVAITAQFMKGKDALEWERRVRAELEDLAGASVDATATPTT